MNAKPNFTYPTIFAKDAPMLSIIVRNALYLMMVQLIATYATVLVLCTCSITHAFIAIDPYKIVNIARHRQAIFQSVLNVTCFII
jgi:hypothetical protein